MPSLKNLYARQILDSRGTPTLEAVAVLETGQWGVAAVPSGSSEGSYEAHELRDGDSSHYLGKGVLKAVEAVNVEIAGEFVGKNVSDVALVDQQLLRLDGTADKSRLGANSTLGVSVAITKALAVAEETPLYRYVAHLSGRDNKLALPTPIFNLINGGKHGAGNLDFQEFHLIPASPSSFATGLEMAVVVYHTLKKILARRGAIHSVGDEGGFAPNLFTNIDALEIIQEAVNETRHQVGGDVNLGLDLAANSFYQEGGYVIKDRSSPLTSAEFIDYLRQLNSQYRLVTLEDPLHEDDWSGWATLTSLLGSQTLIVGDDLLVTNPQRVQKAVAERACNALLAKPDQIGTVSETIGVIKQARQAGWKVIVSHRSGDTNDTFIADFAVGVGADYVKFGAPARGERVAKYNRLLAIESELQI